MEDRIDYACDGKWAAFSLEEFENEFTKGEVVTANNIKALIDIANGHVTILYELVRKAIDALDCKLRVQKIFYKIEKSILDY